MTTFVLCGKGRNLEGMLSQVLRPMTTTFWDAAAACVDASDGLVEEVSGTRLVMRAKYAISFFSIGQGRVPFLPMPFLAVVATMRVSVGMVEAAAAAAMAYVFSCSDGCSSVC